MECEDLESRFDLMEHKSSFSVVGEVPPCAIWNMLDNQLEINVP